jgi:MFS family permease
LTQILYDTREPALPARTRWAILAVVLAADVLDLLDATSTNIAAPTITADLGGGAGLVQWLGASYALALGVLLVPGGRLGDKYGPQAHRFPVAARSKSLPTWFCGGRGRWRRSVHREPRAMSPGQPTSPWAPTSPPTIGMSLTPLT